MSDIVERLRGYNPPDRTIDAERQIASDIAEAADEIERLRGYIEGHEEALTMLRAEIGRLQAERDAYKGTLRHLAGEGITAARRALDEPKDKA
jgi:chromosome segregation ATPase